MKWVSFLVTVQWGWGYIFVALILKHPVVVKTVFCFLITWLVSAFNIADLFSLTVLSSVLTLSPGVWEMSGFYGGVGGCIPAPLLYNPYTFFTNLKSYIIVDLMQKETVRSSKLRKLRNFEVRIRNLRKILSNSVAKENFKNRSNINLFNSSFLHTSSFY